MRIQDVDLTYSLALLADFELRPTGVDKGVMAVCRRHNDEINALIVDNASDPPSLADLAIMAAEHEAEHHGGPAMPDRYATDTRPKPCCEFHAEVEDIQCCHDCPDDPDNAPYSPEVAP